MKQTLADKNNAAADATARKPAKTLAKNAHVRMSPAERRVFYAKMCASTARDRQPDDDQPDLFRRPAAKGASEQDEVVDKNSPLGKMMQFYRRRSLDRMTVAKAIHKAGGDHFMTTLHDLDNEKDPIGRAAARRNVKSMRDALVAQQFGV